LKRAITVLALVILTAAVFPFAAFPQGKKDKDANLRSVEGVVEDPRGNLVEGAVVQLKNMKTLQARSFITQHDGAYHFQGLSPDVDYELKAEFKELSSPVRRLSVYDTRKKVVLDLKLEAKP